MPDFGDGGRLTRRNVKVEPLGDGKSIHDVLDEIYEVLLRRGYAITQGDYHGQALLVLCKQPVPGKLEPVAQVAQIIPGFGTDWRKVGSTEPPIIKAQWES